jgi:hypothetical protein
VPGSRAVIFALPLVKIVAGHLEHHQPAFLADAVGGFETAVEKVPAIHTAKTKLVEVQLPAGQLSGPFNGLCRVDGHVAEKFFQPDCMSTVSIPRALCTMAGTICVGAML